MPRSLLCLATIFVLALCSACLSKRPVARPFTSPMDSRLIDKVPFFPDDTNLCGPSSLAAVMTFHGLPTTVEEVTEGIQRRNLRGSLGPDLVLWARKKGLKARFFSLEPEELVNLITNQKPVILMVDSGLGQVKLGHFLVAVGYNPEGVVANSGLVQQEIIPWSKFLTIWFRTGYFAILVEPNPLETDTPNQTTSSPAGEES